MRLSIPLLVLALLPLTACAQSPQTPRTDTPPMHTSNDPKNAPKIQKTEAEWKAELGEEAYYITRQCGTEPPFTGKYWNHKAAGTYLCVACGTPLFSSETKYESGSGWPSYTAPYNGANVLEKQDTSHGMVRTEVVCATCHAHLGHVFPDGPPPTGLRYCINSAAMAFRPAADADAPTAE